MSFSIEHGFTARLDCRYLQRTPADVDPRVRVVALHGYAMDPETMMALVAQWFPRYAISSIQAPNEFYRVFLKREVGYGWSTHVHGAAAIRLHHDMVSQVLEATGAGPEKRLLIGFSQPVSLNYRYLATRPGSVRGVIGVCGGVPGDWETAPYGKVTASLLHLSRSEDEFYKTEDTRRFADRLRKRADDVTYVELPGAHRFPSKLPDQVGEWVAARFSVSSSVPAL